MSIVFQNIGSKNLEKLNRSLLRKKNDIQIKIYINKIIKSSNFLDLITLLEYILNGNKNYDLSSFKIDINFLKDRIKSLTPIYIEYELKKDLKRFLPLLRKCNELYMKYQIQKPSVEEIKTILHKIMNSYLKDDTIKHFTHLKPFTHLIELENDIILIIKIINYYKEKKGYTSLENNFMDFFMKFKHMIKDKIKLIKSKYPQIII